VITGALGTYTLEGELGRGGMGAVYRARHDPSGREVAIKRLLPQAAEDVELLLRFRREAEALRGIEHPNLVSVLDGQLQGPQPFVVFELVEGPNLRQRVESQGPLLWQEAVQITRDVAAGLAAAHERGLLHRDVKPENVLLSPAGAKLADFGLVKAADLDSLTRSQAGVLGTPGYMAPEQALCERDLGPATDVYGLAATLFFALTGRDPFRADSTIATLRAVIEDPPPSPRAFERSVPGWLADVCARGMAKTPGERFPSAIALRAVLLGGPRESRVGLLGVGAVAAAVVVVVAGGVWAASRGPAAAEGVAPLASSTVLTPAPHADTSPPVPPDEAGDPAPPPVDDSPELAAYEAALHAVHEVPRANGPEALRWVAARLMVARQEYRKAAPDAGTPDALWQLAKSRLTAHVRGESSLALEELVEVALELSDNDRARLTSLVLLLGTQAGEELVDSPPAREAARRLGEAFRSVRVKPTAQELVICATAFARQRPPLAEEALPMLQAVTRRPGVPPPALIHAAAVALHLGDASLGLTLLQDPRLLEPDFEHLGRALTLRLEARRRGAGTPEDYRTDALRYQALTNSATPHLGWALVSLGRWDELERWLEGLQGSSLGQDELALLVSALEERTTSLPPTTAFPLFPRPQRSAVPESVRALARVGELESPQALDALLVAIRRAESECMALDEPARSEATRQLCKQACKLLREAVLGPQAGELARLDDFVALCLQLARVDPALFPVPGGVVADAPPELFGYPATRRALDLLAASADSGSANPWELLLIARARSEQRPPDLAAAERYLTAIAVTAPSADSASLRLGAADLALNVLDRPRLALRLCDAGLLEVQQSEQELALRAIRLVALHNLREWERVLDEQEQLQALLPSEELSAYTRASAMIGLERWGEAEGELARLEALPRRAVSEAQAATLREALERRDPQRIPKSLPGLTRRLSR